METSVSRSCQIEVLKVVKESGLMVQRLVEESLAVRFLGGLPTRLGVGPPLGWLLSCGVGTVQCTAHEGREGDRA